jgi:hypothetical protein
MPPRSAWRPGFTRGEIRLKLKWAVMLKIVDYCAEVGAKCGMRDSAATAKRQRISVLLAADEVEPVEGVEHEERQPYGDADRCGNLDIMSVQRTQPTARLEFSTDRTRTG